MTGALTLQRAAGVESDEGFTTGAAASSASRERRKDAGLG
jgi:hypothetical protein